MEIRVLKNFLAVAEEGNITAAANSLHISQSALSRQMADLEEELNTQLFIRTNRNTELSSDGLLFRERAWRIVELSEQALDEFTSRKTKLTGMIRICTSCASLTSLAAPVIKTVHEEHSNLKFEIISVSPEEAMRFLDEDKCDFALLTEPFAKDPYNFLLLNKNRKIGIVSGKEEIHTESITADQLKEMNLLVFSRFIDPRYAKKLNISRRELHMIGTYTLLAEALPLVREGFAQALCIEPEDLPKDLVFTPLAPEITYETVLAWRKHHLLSPQAVAFLEAFKAKKL